VFKLEEGKGREVLTAGGNGGKEKEGKNNRNMLFPLERNSRPPRGGNRPPSLMVGG